MGTRLKENPERTFSWFFEASCPIARDKDPLVLFQFPEDYNEEESVHNLPRFCFPYDIERVKPSMVVQHFTFVLTDLEGCQRFGFCRQTSGSKSCLCILSYLPWFEVFYKLLNNLADYLTKGQANEMRELLTTLHKHPVPQADSFATLQLLGSRIRLAVLSRVITLTHAGEQLQVTTGVQNPLGGCCPAPSGESGVPYFIAPDPRSLPSIPESRNLTELVVSVDVSNLLQLYASMLFERRILLYSSKLSTLTACVHACSAILFPMYWQHIFIPVLPPHLLDYCCAPMPYLIGVHSSLSERVRSSALEDVVTLNIDTNTIESPFDDLKRIPSQVVSALKVRLKKQSAATGTGVARAFLRAQAELFGGYREALTCPMEGEPITFCKESFLSHKSKSMRQFLESAVHLQFFKQFIDGRLELLNTGRELADLFEEEIIQCGASTGTRPYQQWVGNLKIGGGALIHTVKSKANMCKSATAQAKSCLRNISFHKDDSETAMLYRVGSLHSDSTGSHRRAQSDCLQNRLPITQHFGKSRPRRPNRKHMNPLEVSQQDQGGTWSCSWSSAMENGAPDAQQSGTDEMQLDDIDSELMPDPEEMDLLGEIFDTLSIRSSHERGLIYATRSLDVIGSDSTDFITPRQMTTPSQESLGASTGRSESLLSWGQEGDLEEGQEIETEEGEDGDVEDGPDDVLGKLVKEDVFALGPEGGLRGASEEDHQKNSNGEMSYGQAQEQEMLNVGVERQAESNKEEAGHGDMLEEGLEELRNSEPEAEPASSEPASSSTGVPWEMGSSTERSDPHGEPAKGEDSPTQPKPRRKGDSPVSWGAEAETSKVPARLQMEDPGSVSPVPRVQEALALFQDKAMKKPVGVWRNTPSASPNGRPETRATLEPVDAPAPQVEMELSREARTVPPLKVSELKKRFEA